MKRKGEERGNRDKVNLGFLYLHWEAGGIINYFREFRGISSEGVKLYFQFGYIESTVIIISSKNNSHVLNTYYVSGSVMSCYG